MQVGVSEQLSMQVGVSSTCHKKSGFERKITPSSSSQNVDPVAASSLYLDPASASGEIIVPSSVYEDNANGKHSYPKQASNDSADIGTKVLPCGEVRHDKLLSTAALVPGLHKVVIASSEPRQNVCYQNMPLADKRYGDECSKENYGQTCGNHQEVESPDHSQILAMSISNPCHWHEPESKVKQASDNAVHDFGCSVLSLVRRDKVSKANAQVDAAESPADKILDIPLLSEGMLSYQPLESSIQERNDIAIGSLLAGQPEQSDYIQAEVRGARMRAPTLARRRQRAQCVRRRVCGVPRQSLLPTRPEGFKLPVAVDQALKEGWSSLSSPQSSCASACLHPTRKPAAETEPIDSPVGAFATLSSLLPWPCVRAGMDSTSVPSEQSLDLDVWNGAKQVNCQSSAESMCRAIHAAIEI